MAKTKRQSRNQSFSVRQFFARFSSDEACLEHIMRERYGLRHTCGHCGVVDSSFHKQANRPAYSCASCGARVHPCAGTIFQDARTPLQVWFYAIYLFVTAGSEVSDRELRQTLGLTYKTACRIGMQVDKLISAIDGFEMPQSESAFRTTILELALSSIRHD